MLQFKFIKYVFFSMLFIFFSYNMSFAEEKTIIKVGYTYDRGIISDFDAVDRKGYGFDILKKIEEVSNFSFEFYPYTFEEALKALESHEIDLFGPVVDTVKIKENFAYVTTPIGSLQAVLASTSSKPIFYNDLDKINNSVISVASDNPFLEGFKKYLDDNNISANFIYGNQDNYFLKDADYYLTANINDRFHNYKNALNVSSKEMHFVTSKDNIEFNKKFNDELIKLTLHEKNFMNRAYLFYYDNIALTKKYLTKEESEFLKGKKFRVGYTIDHAPIQFQNENKKPDGIAVEILNLLARKHDFSVEYVGYKPDDPPSVKKNFDILLSIKDNYKNIFDFYNQSEAFLRLPMVLMLNVEGGKLFNRDEKLAIGLYNYTTLDYSKITKEFVNSSVHTYDSIQEAFAGYVADDFNAGMFTTTGAEYVHQIFGTEDTQVIGTKITLPLRFFLSKEISNEYLAIFNTAIGHLDEADLNEIVSRQSLAFLPKTTILKIIKENLAIVFISILLVVLIVVFAFSHEHKVKRQQIQKVINTDSLTGLISLHRFRELMKEKLSVAKVDEYEIITLDIDYFRIINNIYGFEYGSKTIIAIAEALKASYKNSDAIISRIVGDLFVILHKISEEENIQVICYKDIIPAIQAVVGESYNLSMSIGTYRINDCSKDVNAIIDRANIARLSGKKDHNLTCNAFDAKMQRTFEKRTDIVFRMEQALKDKEFNVYLQPKINYSTLEIEGAEALIRWFPKNASMFYPDEFIPVFEANGFIMNLDFYVFEEVLKFIKEHSSEVKLPVISVNLSGRTLFDNSTPFKLLGLLKKYQISPSLLEVEVTESAILDNDKYMAGKVDELKKIGLAVSMDDFGAGVSSLNRLSSMNIDIIKLDKSFLDYNSQVSKGSIIVENIVRMAKDLNMKVVTEGVENANQALWLKNIGCHLAQGYFFEKPLASKDFIELLKTKQSYTI